jgi:3-keto-L-gulonate-6-phosphate decarboxylase
MVAIFGGIEDKRPPQLNAIPDKILVIVGTSIFGGIDIKSF